MLLERSGDSALGRNSCSTFTTLPARRNSTHSLVCEASSLYPSAPRRQGSLSHLERTPYDTYTSQIHELRDNRLPPPSRSTGQGRRRRLSAASSQGSRAAHAGSGHDFFSDRGSRCHSSLGHFTMDHDLWSPRNRSSSDLLNEVNMPSSSTNTRNRVWSEAGRSCDETTIRASLRNFRARSDYLVPGSRQTSTRRFTSDEHSTVEGKDLMNFSFNDLRDPSIQEYEKIHFPREKRRKQSRDHRVHSSYEDPSSLEDDFHGR